MLQAMAVTAPPVAAISARVGSRCSTEREQMTTCAPSAASSRATARPMPVPPPLTTMVWSAKRLSRKIDCMGNCSLLPFLARSRAGGVYRIGGERLARYHHAMDERMRAGDPDVFDAVLAQHLGVVADVRESVEDGEPPAGPQHTLHLAQRLRPAARRHVVQHQAGEHDIEAGVGEGQVARVALTQR